MAGTVALADEDRGDALVYAADHGNVEAVRLMLDVGFPVGARDRDGTTALHAAAGSGSADAVAALIAAGADLESRDAMFGGTPLSWATVGSGLRMGRNPAPDRAGTVRGLLDAGAGTDGAWVVGKPPSREVADILAGYGVHAPADEP